MHVPYLGIKDQKEVDFVIERGNGKMVAIEVKSRTSIDQKDFKGLNPIVA